MRRSLIAILAGLLSGVTLAQTTPQQPASLTITPTTLPEVLQVLDNTGTWVPIGNVNPTSHTFAVAGSFSTHAALVTGAKSNSGAVSQQGFYAPGDGGGATYNWNLTSTCVADGILCVLPIGQTPTTVGRYLLQYGPEFDVRQAGLQAGGVFDNGPALAALLTALGTGYSGGPMAFPAQQPTPTQYYFGSSFNITTNGLTVDCGGVGLRATSVQLIFAAGIDGVLQSGGSGANDIRGCELLTQSYFIKFAAVTSGDTVVTGISSGPGGGPFFTVGDGVLVKGTTQSDAPLATAVGETVTAVGSGSITLATPVTHTGSYYTALWRFPAALASSVTTTSGSNTVTTTGGPYFFKSGDVVWSDAFPFGTMVLGGSGTLGAQTLVMANMYATTAQNATVSHAAGSGKMWLVPAALKRTSPGKSHQLYTVAWPFGISMACSSAGGANCTSSVDHEFSSEANLIGRYAAGNNPGGSQDFASFYVSNLRADIMDLGTIGSTYVGEIFESAEGNSGNDTSITLNCLNENESIFFGIYNDQSHGTCAGADAYNDPNQATGKMIIGNLGEINPAGTLVVDANGTFAGGSYRFTSGYNASANCVELGGLGGYPQYLMTFSPSCGVADGLSVVWDAANSSFDLSQWVYGSWIRFPVGGTLSPVFPVGLTMETDNYNGAALPACNASGAGRLIAIFNGVANPVYNSVVAGGGSTAALAFCNGTNWTYH